MEPTTKMKNFDKRMTGASLIDDQLKEVSLLKDFIWPIFGMNIFMLNASYIEFSSK